MEYSVREFYTQKVAKCLIASQQVHTLADKKQLLQLAATFDSSLSAIRARTAGTARRLALQTGLVRLETRRSLFDRQP
jgi:hypothetical protein